VEFYINDLKMTEFGRSMLQQYIYIYCMFFAPCIMIQLHNTNQRNAQFSKLIF